MSNEIRQQPWKTKSWWAPVWRGLVVDERSTHRREMGSAVWLFLYLIIHANRKTGEVLRRTSTICSEMSVNEKTVRRWRQRLLDRSYITIDPLGGRPRVIRIARWRSIVKSGTTGQH